MRIQKKIHSIISKRRRRNAINLVSVDGVSVEGVQGVRDAVFTHFSNHFKRLAVDRPCVDDLPFHKISHGEAGNLIKTFQVGRGKASGLGL